MPNSTNWTGAKCSAKILWKAQVQVYTYMYYRQKRTNFNGPQLTMISSLYCARSLLYFCFHSWKTSQIVTFSNCLHEANSILCESLLWMQIIFTRGSLGELKKNRGNTQSLACQLVFPHFLFSQTSTWYMFSIWICNNLTTNLQVQHSCIENFLSELTGKLNWRSHHLDH